MLFRSMLIVLTFVIVGCSGENESKKEILEIKIKSGAEGENGKAGTASDELTCITGLGETFTKYFDGKMQVSEINEFWGCFDTIANVYIDNARSITMDGLINVIQKFLDKSTSKINLKAYKKEFRDFKKVLLGNKRNQFSEDELNHFRYIINTAFPKAMGMLSPELPELFSLKSKGEMSNESANQSIEVLEQSILTLTSEFRGSYSQEDLKLFARFIDNEFLNKGSFKTEAFVPVLFNIKKRFLGGEGSFIEANDWQRITEIAVKVYGSLYKWKRIKKDHALNTKEGFEVLDEIVNELHSLIKEGLKLSKDNLWSDEDLAETMESVAQLGFLPQDLTSKDLMEAWVVISRNVFKNENNNFTEDSLEFIMSHYLSWSKNQKQIISSGGLSGDLKNFVEGMQWPLFHSNDGRLVFPGNSVDSIKADSSNSYSKFNTFHILSSVLMESYSEDGVQLSWDELQSLFEDFKPLALKLGAPESLYKSIPQILFIFGNSFLPNSKADAVFHKYELINILSYAISSQATSRVWQKEAGDSCFPKTDCMLDYLSTDMAWDVIPVWSDTVLKSKAVRDDLSVMLSPFSKLEEEVTSTNLLIGSLVSQVIESLVIGQDKDGDGLLNTKETLSVIDTLWPAVSVALGTDSQELKETLLATSTYILKYNELPTDNKLSKLRFEHWKVRDDKWNLSVSRLDFINLVSKIKAILP